MVDTNENLPGMENDNLEDTKQDEYIQTMELFRLLLGKQLKEDKINEDGAEGIDENDYLLSVMLQEGIRQGYDQDGFISQIRDFEKNGYVTLSVDDEADLDQLIHDKLYEKIHICLNEARMLYVLLNDSIILNRSVRDLETALQKQKSVWEQYEKHRQEMKNWYDETNLMKKSIENTIEADKEKREEEAEKLKIDVESITENTAESQIEEALKLSGKIGAAMQDMQKDIIQFMGIFIAIFALLGLNISNAGKWSTANFFHINLIITAAMSTMLFLLSIIMKGKSPRTSCMGILTAILWIAAAFAFFVFPYLKDEIISFWATYYK